MLNKSIKGLVLNRRKMEEVVPTIPTKRKTTSKKNKSLPQTIPTETPVENPETVVENSVTPITQLVEKTVTKKKIPRKQADVSIEPPTVLPKSKPTIEIVLDERERGLYEEIQKISTSVAISKRVLSIGDILIQQQGEDTPLLIVERKSLQDLLASIKDGRYTEQSFRLLNASQLPPHRILYCIEGMMRSLNPDDAKRVYSAITSIHYYKGMSVLRTWSVQETAELLVRTAEKIQKETDRGKIPENAVVMEGGGGGGYSHSLSSVSAVKSENITPENVGEIMLSQIPSVSIASAKSILAVFEGNFMRFMEALKQNDPVLQQVYFVEGALSKCGKRRKISNKCMENIRRLLLPIDFGTK